MEGTKRRSSDQKKLRKDALKVLDSLSNEEVSCFAMECSESAFREAKKFSWAYSNGQVAADEEVGEYFHNELSEVVDGTAGKALSELGDLVDSLDSGEVRDAIVKASADTLKNLNPRDTDEEGFVTDYLVYEVYRKLQGLGLKVLNPNKKMHIDKSFTEFVECIKARFNVSKEDYLILKVLAEASDKDEMMAALQIARKIGVYLRGANLVTARLRHLREVLKIYGLDIAKNKNQVWSYTAPMFYKFERDRVHRG